MHQTKLYLSINKYCAITKSISNQTHAETLLDLNLSIDYLLIKVLYINPTIPSLDTI